MRAAGPFAATLAGSSRTAIGAIGHTVAIGVERERCVRHAEDKAKAWDGDGAVGDRDRAAAAETEGDIAAENGRRPRADEPFGRHDAVPVRTARDAERGLLAVVLLDEADKGLLDSLRTVFAADDSASGLRAAATLHRPWLWIALLGLALCAGGAFAEGRSRGKNPF